MNISEAEAILLAECLRIANERQLLEPRKANKHVENVPADAITIFDILKATWELRHGTQDQKQARKKIKLSQLQSEKD